MKVLYIVSLFFLTYLSVPLRWFSFEPELKFFMQKRRRQSLYLKRSFKCYDKEKCNYWFCQWDIPEFRNNIWSRMLLSIWNLIRQQKRIFFFHLDHNEYPSCKNENIFDTIELKNTKKRNMRNHKIGIFHRNLLGENSDEEFAAFIKHDDARNLTVLNLHEYFSGDKIRSKNGANLINLQILKPFTRVVIICFRPSHSYTHFITSPVNALRSFYGDDRELYTLEEACPMFYYPKETAWGMDNILSNGAVEFIAFTAPPPSKELMAGCMNRKANDIYKIVDFIKIRIVLSLKKKKHRVVQGVSTDPRDAGNWSIILDPAKKEYEIPEVWQLVLGIKIKGGTVQPMDCFKHVYTKGESMIINTAISYVSSSYLNMDTPDEIRRFFSFDASNNQSDKAEIMCKFTYEGETYKVKYGKGTDRTPHKVSSEIEVTDKSQFISENFKVDYEICDFKYKSSTEILTCERTLHELTLLIYNCNTPEVSDHPTKEPMYAVHSKSETQTIADLSVIPLFSDDLMLNDFKKKFVGYKFFMSPYMDIGDIPILIKCEINEPSGSKKQTAYIMLRSKARFKENTVHICDFTSSKQYMLLNKYTSGEICKIRVGANSKFGVKCPEGTIKKPNNCFSNVYKGDQIHNLKEELKENFIPYSEALPDVSVAAFYNYVTKSYNFECHCVNSSNESEIVKRVIVQYRNYHEVQDYNIYETKPYKSHIVKPDVTHLCDFANFNRPLEPKNYQTVNYKCKVSPKPLQFVALACPTFLKDMYNEMKVSQHLSNVTNAFDPEGDKYIKRRESYLNMKNLPKDAPQFVIDKATLNVIEINELLPGVIVPDLVKIRLLYANKKETNIDEMSDDLIENEPESMVDDTNAFIKEDSEFLDWATSLLPKKEVLTTVENALGNQDTFFKASDNDDFTLDMEEENSPHVLTKDLMNEYYLKYMGTMNRLEKGFFIFQLPPYIKNELFLEFACINAKTTKLGRRGNNGIMTVHIKPSGQIIEGCYFYKNHNLQRYNVVSKTIKFGSAERCTIKSEGGLEYVGLICPNEDDLYLDPPECFEVSYNDDNIKVRISEKHTEPFGHYSDRKGVFYLRIPPSFLKYAKYVCYCGKQDEIGSFKASNQITVELNVKNKSVTEVSNIDSIFEPDFLIGYGYKKNVVSPIYRKKYICDFMSVGQKLYPQKDSIEIKTCYLELEGNFNMVEVRCPRNYFKPKVKEITHRDKQKPATTLATLGNGKLQSSSVSLSTQSLLKKGTLKTQDASLEASRKAARDILKDHEQLEREAAIAREQEALNQLQEEKVFDNEFLKNKKSEENPEVVDDSVDKELIDNEKIDEPLPQGGKETVITDSQNRLRYKHIKHIPDGIDDEIEINNKKDKIDNILPGIIVTNRSVPFSQSGVFSFISPLLVREDTIIKIQCDNTRTLYRNFYGKLGMAIIKIPKYETSKSLIGCNFGGQEQKSMFFSKNFDISTKDALCEIPIKENSIITLNCPDGKISPNSCFRSVYIKSYFGQQIEENIKNIFTNIKVISSEFSITNSMAFLIISKIKDNELDFYCTCEHSVSNKVGTMYIRNPKAEHHSGNYSKHTLLNIDVAPAFINNTYVCDFTDKHYAIRADKEAKVLDVHTRYLTEFIRRKLSDFTNLSLNLKAQKDNAQKLYSGYLSSRTAYFEKSAYSESNISDKVIVYNCKIDLSTFDKFKIKCPTANPLEVSGGAATEEFFYKSSLGNNDVEVLDQLNKLLYGALLTNPNGEITFFETGEMEIIIPPYVESFKIFNFSCESSKSVTGSRAKIGKVSIFIKKNADKILGCDFKTTDTDIESTYIKSEKSNTFEYEIELVEGKQSVCNIDATANDIIGFNCPYHYETSPKTCFENVKMKGKDTEVEIHRITKLIKNIKVLSNGLNQHNVTPSYIILPPTIRKSVSFFCSCNSFSLIKYGIIQINAIGEDIENMFKKNILQNAHMFEKQHYTYDFTTGPFVISAASLVKLSDEQPKDYLESATIDKYKKRFSNSYKTLESDPDELGDEAGVPELPSKISPEPSSGVVPGTLPAVPSTAPGEGSDQQATPKEDNILNPIRTKQIFQINIFASEFGKVEIVCPMRDSSEYMQMKLNPQNFFEYVFVVDHEKIKAMEKEKERARIEEEKKRAEEEAEGSSYEEELFGEDEIEEDTSVKVVDKSVVFDKQGNSIIVSKEERNPLITVENDISDTVINKILNENKEVVTVKNIHDVISFVNVKSEVVDGKYKSQIFLSPILLNSANFFVVCDNSLTTLKDNQRGKIAVVNVNIQSNHVVVHGCDFVGIYSHHFRFSQHWKLLPKDYVCEVQITDNSIVGMACPHHAKIHPSDCFENVVRDNKVYKKDHLFMTKNIFFFNLDNKDIMTFIHIRKAVVTDFMCKCYSGEGPSYKEVTILIRYELFTPGSQRLTLDKSIITVQDPSRLI